MYMKTPRQYLEELETATDHFSRLSEHWADLIIYQAQYYGKHRHEHKSDTAVQRAFDRTEKGIEMQITRAKIKSKEKQISTIKTAMRLLDSEARNII